MAKKREPKLLRKSYLIVQPIVEFGFGEYQYFVETPEHEVFYFHSKVQAREFIEFYKYYKEKNPERFVPKKLILSADHV